jgi:hypothetical protein
MEVPLLMEFIQRKRYPPISERYQRMIGAVTAPSIAFDRPESIEAERRRIERSRSRKHLYIGMLTMLCVILGAWLGMYLRKNAHHLNVPWRPKPRLQLQR